MAACPQCDSALALGDLVCTRCGAAVPTAETSMGAASRLFARADEAPANAAPAAETPAAEAPAAEALAGEGRSPWEAVLARLRTMTDGEFEIGRELGRGGMAAVFLARDLALNRRVAIKVMAPGLMMGEGMVERFRQEAITIANLSHAHIVSIHAVRQFEDLHFFVMQFVAGQSLESVLRTHGPLPVPVVRALLFQVATALAYAHRRGVVHRDIKPANILMSGDGDALVTDFGIAKVAEGPTQTQTGMVVGTPTYMSPEQCLAQELDGSSDQYSLGVVAFELLTGTVPFSGPAFTIMRGHTIDVPPALLSRRPDAPPELAAAVMRMLSKTPSERFASFGEAISAMGATAVGEGDVLREQLIRLAGVEERRTMLGSLLHTPALSPRASGQASGRTSGGTSGGTSGPVTAIAIAPITTSLEVGDTTPLQARVLGDTGDVTLQWSVDAPTLAVVDNATGQLTAIAPGTGQVMATVGSVTERTPFVVVAPRVAAIRLLRPAEPLRVGTLVRLRAQLLDKRERPVDRPVEWRADGDSIQLAHSGGTECTAECTAEGPTAVTVSCEGVSSTEVLRVSPASDTATASGAPVIASQTPRSGWMRGVVATVVIVVIAAGAAWKLGGFARDDEAAPSTIEASAAADGNPPDVVSELVPQIVPDVATVDAPVDPPRDVQRATAPTQFPPPVERATPRPQPPAESQRAATPPPAAVQATPQETELQQLLAREARAIVASFGSAIESRQIARVRAVYPGLSAQNVEQFQGMFANTRALQVRVGDIAVVGGGTYDATMGARTVLTADVSYEMQSLAGGTLPLVSDVWPVTLQRTASGWKLEQIGVP